MLTDAGTPPFTRSNVATNSPSSKAKPSLFFSSAAMSSVVLPRSQLSERWMPLTKPWIVEPTAWIFATSPATAAPAKEPIDVNEPPTFENKFQDVPSFLHK